MLSFLQEKGLADERRLRLFACACCRAVWHLLGDRQHRKLVLVAERYADGKTIERAIKKADQDAHYASLAGRGGGMWHAEFAAHCLCAAAFSVGLARRVAVCVAEGLAEEAAEREQPVTQSPLPALLRDTFNPFRGAASEAAARTPEVQVLAQRIYDERAFDHIPELAGALAAAGCRDAEVLAHLRSPGPHVRGCWAVDLVLGRA